MSDLLKVKVGGSDYLCKWTDPRYVEIGGRDYLTVKIGNQQWLAENLDYMFDGLVFNPSDWNSTTRNCCYFHGGQTPYKSGYGMLYNGYAMKYLNDNCATLLPSGWHVPSKSEFSTLITAVGGTSVAGKKLKSTSGWASGNGTDDYGFTALPAGALFYYGAWTGDDVMTGYWTSTANGNTKSYRYRIQGGDEINESIYDNKYGYSLRLVKTLS